MACIDAHGKLTRSGELILLAMMEPADIETAAEESGQELQPRNQQSQPGTKRVCVQGT